jgi:hypothetical protein
MSTTMLDVILHIDEDTSHEEREALRDVLLRKQGVLTADCRDDKPHLMIVGYDPEDVSSVELLAATKNQGYHAELIGM